MRGYLRGHPDEPGDSETPSAYLTVDPGEPKMLSSKARWILVALRAAPLDRVHLMKALFLFWRRAKGELPDYFVFEPYLYGPYSSEVYRVLDELEKRGLIIQPIHPIQHWAKYYLTKLGREAADTEASSMAPELRQQLESVTSEVAHLSFYELLQRVYEEAPEFAVNSVMRGSMKP